MREDMSDSEKSIVGIGKARRLARLLGVGSASVATASRSIAPPNSPNGRKSIPDYLSREAYHKMKVTSEWKLTRKC